MDDRALLSEFIRNQSHDSFHALVDRHLPMVYSVAWRILREDSLAEEAAQEVFVTFARKAAGIQPRQMIAGWLYNTARHIALHSVRREQRRREREQTASAMQALDDASDTSWIHNELEPAMSALEPSERDVLVLRFLEGRTLRDVASELSVSEDAARMRVNRALERLREIFARDGIKIPCTVLGPLLLGTTVSTLPSGLAASVAAISLTAPIAGGGASHAIITAMNWINTKTAAAFVGAAVLTGTGTYIVEQRKIDRLQSELESTRAKADRLQEDHASTAATLQITRDELDRVRSEASDVIRLRREVSELRDAQERARRAQAQAAAAGPDRSPEQNPAGNYLDRTRLSHVGYDTPEAALQTLTWAAMTGDARQAQEGLSDRMLSDTNAYAAFESNRQQLARVWSGMEVESKKVVQDDRVEFKVNMDMQATPDGSTPVPQGMVVTLIKTPGGWKLAGSTRYRNDWEQTGRIEPVTGLNR